MGSGAKKESTTTSTRDTAVINTAMKSLERKDSGSMKLKKLAKDVVKKISNDDSSGNKSQPPDIKTVKKLIKKSDSFHIDDDKVVSLVSSSATTSSTGGKKRKADVVANEDSNNSDDNSNDNKEQDSNKSNKKSKKEKKDKKKKDKKDKKKKQENDDNSDNNNNSDSDIAQWRKEHLIVLKDTKDDADGLKASKELNASASLFPYKSFDCCKDEVAAPLLKQCTVVNKFDKPTPIQSQCWPVLLHTDEHKKRHDVVGIAETGSGKTLAFALPALTSMYNEDQKAGTSYRPKKLPRMLVLAPTRELAMQSHVVIEEFGSVVNLKSLVIYGGVPKHTQTKELKSGKVDVIVATPGRLKDLITERTCNLKDVKFLVLDEADRMLDMGFEEDVRFIIQQCKSKEERQTCMFSATWPAIIQQIALEYMINPIRIYVGFESLVVTNEDGSSDNGASDGAMIVDDSLSANKRVKQIVQVIDDHDRHYRLKQLLKEYHDSKGRSNRILIFALYKKEAERLEFTLKREGYNNCCSIHGNKNQVARTDALQSFKSGKCPLLIATDVAARGLDIPNVEMVINYTFPLTIEDYVHRIGRTGRAGKNGLSYTFFQPTDKSHAGELQQVMKQANQDVPDELKKFGSTIKRKEHKLYGNFGPSNGEPMKKAVKITFDSDDE